MNAEAKRTFPCASCRRRLRPEGTTVEEFPGTLTAHSGICSRCSEYRATHGKLPSEPTNEFDGAEMVVVGLVNRRYGRDAFEVLDMLGLVRA